MSILLSATVLAASVALGDTGGARDTDGARLQPDRNFLLVTRPPYPPGRTARTVTRDSGLLWYSTSPIGTRTPINSDTLAFPGPSFFGAPADASTDLIMVRTREPLPLVAISPFTQFEQVDLNLLKREMPWIRRTPTIQRDIQRAQHIWLRENGMILGVRTHVHPSTFASAQAPVEDAASSPAADIQPRGVIKVHPVDPEKAPLKQAEAISTPPVVRVSMPDNAAPRGPITVLTPEPAKEPTQVSSAE
jgi:hypothetical protein